ncbi:cyclopropane-fatty-acyl-phospholipid synthase family protein [Aestuariivirga sp.]|uniref:cyclopropane-fatty-acyl-phospholipid synthase family protein n=1 Tax=Aestuariivirga sp. TaxID=2650926 RepID=UPI003016B6C1
MKLLNTMLTKIIRTGTLEVVDAEGTVHRYAGTPEPFVRVKLHDPSLYSSLVWNPDLKAGEAYMDGTLTIEQGTLRDFLTLFAINRGVSRKLPIQRPLRRMAKRLKSLWQRNTLVQSQRNVAHHYDLSNELYGLFLDSGMNYSCAYFRSPMDTLEEAQQNKLRHIASKLDLKPGQRVLDIGCGWGGMAIYLAQNFDVHVTGVTLSKEQLALAQQRAEQLGLADKISFQFKDYRDVAGTFDRIVSIGMFEHVGISYFQQYFGKIQSLLAPDGVALVHAIGRKGGPGTTGKWLRKYIFPGGYSPALSETFAAIESSGLWVTDTEIWRLHYAETLRAWYDRFEANRDKAEALLGETFCRMWEFYLITSELSFRYFKHMVFQIQLAKTVDTLPLQRDYMVDIERELIAAEGKT